eukprot:6450840-Prymnesium_polylepis.1
MIDTDFGVGADDKVNARRELAFSWARLLNYSPRLHLTSRASLTRLWRRTPRTFRLASYPPRCDRPSRYNQATLCGGPQ